MSRALLFVAAGLAAVLAFVLDVSLLYLAAAALLVVAGVLWFLGFRGKFDIGKPDSIGFAPPDEDLAAFGILEIRAKAKGHNGVHRPEREDLPPDLASGSPEEQDGPSGGGAREPSLPSASYALEDEDEQQTPKEDVHVVDAEPVVESRHRSSVTFAALSMVDTLDPDVIAPFLQTAAVALGATTVCLLGYDDEKDRHRIHAVISQNAYVRSAGDLPFTNPLPFGDPRPGRVVVTRVSEAKWGLDELKYYREPISVREVARVLVPVEASAERFLLVADVMRNASLRSARSRTLLKRFAAILSTLLETETKVPSGGKRSDSRPRRDIIADEIAGARNEGRPLALALVMCTDADDVRRSAAERGKVEKELMQKLAESVDGLRVEKFGELMVGVFFSAEAAEVEAWALHIQEELPQSSKLLRNGVSVGVAMLMDRHEEPDELRADAAAALQEAFESGACTILA